MIDEATPIPAGKTLIVFHVGGDDAEDQNEDGVPDGLSEQPGSLAVSGDYWAKAITLIQDQREYRVELSTANWTPAWAIAFIDLDDNGVLDVGEPFAGERAPDGLGSGCGGYDSWNVRLVVGGAYTPP